MDLRDQLDVLRKRWLTVLVVLVLSVAVVGIGSSMVSRKYTATTLLFFGVQGGGSITDLTQGSSYIEQQMASYVRVATSPLVLRPVIQDLGLKVRPVDLAEQVKASVPMDTVILQVDVTSTDPAQAAAIANRIGAEVVTVAGDLTPEQSNSVKPVRATVLTEAEIPESPSSPDLLLNVGIAVALGLAAGIATALARDALNTRVRSEDDVESLTAAPVLGQIPLESNPTTSAGPIMLDDGPHSEAIRRLRTNLEFVDLAQKAKTVVVTSSIGGEGKTTTLIDLGRALAASGRRVVVVDADLRTPSLHDRLSLKSAPGLTNVLIGQAQLGRDVLHRVGDDNFDVLCAGPVPPNPTELLASPSMTALLNELGERYDLVLVDSAPLLPLSDALVLSRAVDGSLLVADVERLHRRQFRQALESLEAIDVNVLGIVLNKVSRRALGAYAAQAPQVLDWSAANPPADWEADPSPNTRPHQPLQR